MSRKFRVTAKGKHATWAPFKFTSDVVRFTLGFGGTLWTMQSTYYGAASMDDEGWAPWPRGTSIASALAKGYIKEVPDE